MNVSKSTKFLESSPMFQMSLGSRELFHSNFLKWLFETYSSSIEILGISVEGGFKVLAEQKHMDLIIRSETNENKILAVIENKFKDIPNKRQLENYKSKEPKAEKYILLSLVPASFQPDGWTPLSYNDLGISLQRWFDDYKGAVSKRDKIFTLEYITMVQCIDQVVSKHANPDKVKKDYWFGDQLDPKLEEIRFADTIKKIQGQTMAQIITEKLEKSYPKLRSESDGNHIVLRVDNSLANKTPCVTISAAHDEKEPIVKLFVQIQGSTYRHMVVSRVFKIEENKGDGFKNYLVTAVKNTDDGKWLFSQVDSCEIARIEKHDFKLPSGTKSYETSARLHFNSYSPDNIYQYIDIAKPNSRDNGLPCETIIDTIIQDIKRAITLLQDSDYIQKYEAFEGSV